MDRTVFEDAVSIHEAAGQSDGSGLDARPLAPERPPARTSATALERHIARRLLAAAGHPPVTIELWDGTAVSPSSGQSVGRLWIADRATVWKLAFDPLWEFGEAYMEGRLEVTGKLEEILSVLFRWLNERGREPLVSRLLKRWLHRPRRNTLNGSRHNVRHHYDLGNDFYRLWLDEQLVYTCAYFPQPCLTIEQAQTAKLDYVSRKLRLRPGETVVEAGCGWGALALHMARHYGVKVKACNLSHEQITYARQRAGREGLSGQVEFIEDDWRSLSFRCDAFVSVGMLEHVGPDQFEELGEVIHRCLAPHGRGLIHSIGQNCPRPMNPWIERHIFPGAYPPTLSEAMSVFENRAFSVLDVENLRLHYSLTLKHWLDRFERVAPRVVQAFGEQFVRMWRLYLCGSLAAFDSGSLQLFQILFARETNNDIPWNRGYLYSGAAGGTL